MKRKTIALLVAAAMACQPVLVSAEEFVSQDEFTADMETAQEEEPVQNEEPGESQDAVFGISDEQTETAVTGFENEPEDDSDVFTDSNPDIASDGWDDGTVAAVGDRGENIPSDALYYNGHYYAVFNLHSGWNEAKAYCESLGGYLATITSQEENDAVFAYILDQGYDSAYFGLTDEETEGTWKWVTSEKMDYTNWHPGEPNSENEHEDYGMFYYKFPDGTWNDGDFGGSTVGNDRAFLCEWGTYTKAEEQPDYALRPEQVWGFTQGKLSALTGNLNLGYYTKFFSPAHALILLLADNGSGGYCSGMATSVNAISGYGCVPISSFRLSDGTQAANLSNITDPTSLSVLTLKKASDYVKYAHVYQNTFTVQSESRKHKNDLNGLYQAVKNSVTGNGDYVEIRIRGDYAGETNIGHCLLAMGISKDTDSEVEILVYDGNFSSDLKKFYLYKTDGQITSWKYDQKSSGFVDWGTGKSNNQITYTTSGKKFKDDMSSGIDGIMVDTYNYLISVKSKNTSVKAKNKTQSLNRETDSTIIPLDIYNGTGNSSSNIYWIDTDGEIGITSHVSDNDIQISSNDKTVSADIPANALVSVDLNNKGLKTDISSLSYGNDFSVTLTQYSESASATAATVTGTANSKAVTIQKEAGNKVDINGAIQAEVQFLNADGTKTEKVKVDLKGKPSQIEQTAEKTTVKQDTDGNGTYDKLVYDSSDNGKIEAPKLNKTSSAYNSIKVTWSPVTKAEKYQVYRKVNKGKWKAVKYVTGTSYTDKNVKAGNTYCYTVKACRTVDGKQVYSTYNTKGVSGKLTTSISLKTKSRKVTISWKKTKSAAGYYIYRASSAKGKYSKIKKVTSGKTLKYTDKKVKKGKTYYYKVVPYGKNGKKIVKCNASTVKKIKVK